MISIALTLLGGLWPFGDEIDVRRYAPAKGWVLVVEKDRFTGESRCTGRRRGGVTYRNGVVTFRFGEHVGTAQAQFRVDGGPARWARDFAVEAAGKGASFRSDNLDNPTGGLVHLPASVLQGAGSVAIRPDRDGRARTFSLKGLAETMAAAQAQGCRVA